MQAPPKIRPSDEPRILLAEDDDALRELLAERLVALGAEVIACKHGLELVEELDHAFGPAGDKAVDMVITDIRMPGVSGMSILAGLKALDRKCPILLMTAFGDDATHAEAKRLDATALFDKPFDIGEFLEFVERILGRD